MKLRVEKYNVQYELVWDEFIEKISINGSFLQERRFLNYHKKGRFEDCSLLFFDGDKLLAVCPACIVREKGEKIFYSHMGSTYGGILVGRELLRIDKIKSIYEIFESYLQIQGFHKCVLKMTMDLLCEYPQDVIKFFMSHSGYREIKELNTYVDYRKYDKVILNNFSKMKKRNVRKCMKSEMELRKLQSDEEISVFYQILSKNLQKYHTLPVHTLEELLDLKRRLESNIEFYGVYWKEKFLAGTMVFLFEKARCAHTQYLAADPDYSAMNPMTFLYYKTVKQYLEKGFYYLSWGTVTEHGGERINFGLSNHKEEFGSLHIINSIFEKQLAL